MLRQKIVGLRRLSTLALCAMLIATAGTSAAACGEAGEPCQVNSAPAVQVPANSPDLGVGNPINVITGNKYQQEVDLPALPGVLGLEIVRHYNSSQSGPKALPGSLGRGWRLSYETELLATGNNIEVMQADGSQLLFGRDLVDRKTARHLDPARGSIAVTTSARGDEYTWNWRDGRKLSFNSKGKLIQIQAASGEILSLQHDARGLLVRVTDPQGRSLRLAWLGGEAARAADRFRGVQSIDTPVGRFSYSYGSPMPKTSVVDKRSLLANLVEVGYPAAAGASRTRRYHYEDGLHPTLLTGISFEKSDLAGQNASMRHATYAYRGDGKAVMSTHAGDANKVTLDFSLAKQTTMTNSLGQKTNYRYTFIDGEHRLLEVRGLGCSNCGEPNLRYAYNKSGRLTDIIKLDEAGKPLAARRIDPDQYGRPLRVSHVAYVGGKAQAPHILVRYEYGAGDAPVLVARPSVVAGQELVTRFHYNASGQTQRIEVNGWAPRIAPGTPAQQITRITSYTYRMINARSVLVEIDGPLVNGPLRSAVDSDIISLEYDATGSYVTRTMAPGKLSGEVLARDDALRPTLLRSGDGMRFVDKQTTYSQDGQVSTIIRKAWMLADPGAVLTRDTRFGYDALGRLATATSPDGTIMRAEYDSAGRPAALIDPKGNRVESNFDSEGKLVAAVTQDSQGNILNGVFKLWDENNQLRAVLHPSRIVSAQSASVEGVPLVAFGANLAARVDIARGEETDIAMPDRSSRQVRIREAGVALADGGRRLHATLNDDFGRMVMEIAPDHGRYFYSYKDRLVEKTHLAIDGKRKVTETLRYAASGLLLTRTWAGCAEKLHYEGALLLRLEGCGTSIVYRRDAFGAITSVQNLIAAPGNAGAAPLNFTETFSYDRQSGRLEERRLPDGQRLAYRYDRISGAASEVLRDSGWIAWIDRRLGPAVAVWLRAMLPSGWTEQPVLSQVQWRPFGGMAGATAFNGVKQLSRFDQAGQTTSLRIGTTAGGDNIESLRYEYDRAGLMTASIRGRRETHYRYDRMQRLTDEQPAAHAIDMPARATRIDYNPLGRRGGAEAPLHDSFGRQSGSGVLRYQYDDAHRLAVVSGGDDRAVARYRYDVRGNRIAKTVGAHTTYFIYDNNHRVVAEAGQDGKVTVQYLYSDHRPYAMMQSNGAAQARTLYAIHADHRGLPLAVTDHRQEVVWRARFDAFGDRRGVSPESASSLVLNLRMAGQYEDWETGLYYNVHRYYDPRNGRYITPDPFGLAGGEDAYAYLDSNPLLDIDPLGLFKIPAWAADGNAAYFERGYVDPRDGGHGDILRAAFFLYQKANPGRFSQDIIKQIIINNYHTDAENKEAGCLPLLAGITGGGQCVHTNHFDNPNASAGAPYEAIEQIDPITKAKTYKPTTEFRSTYTNTTWIEDALDAVDAYRERYGDFENNGAAGVDISQAINAFGRNSHILADFYSHSNWVDSGAKGGCWQKTVWGKTLHGWVPEGLNRRDVWDEGLTPLSTVFTGTVAGTWDILFSSDKSTHGYWNKDTDTLSKDETANYNEFATTDFNSEKMFYWMNVEYDSKKHVEKDYKSGKVGGWETVSGSTVGLKAGEMIFVATPIINRHRMATHLAVQHTMKEIEKLWAAAAGKKLGQTGKTFQQAFNMDKDHLQANGIHYSELWPKDKLP